jgi:hypothetical protein
VIVVDPVLHDTLHCRFDGHTTPPDELPPDEPPLLLLPPNEIPLEAPLDAPLDAPLPPLLAPPLLAPPEDPKPLPVLPPPQEGARISATVEAKVAQLTVSVRRFMTRVSPSEVQARVVGSGDTRTDPPQNVLIAAHPAVCAGSSKECLRLGRTLRQARKVPSAAPM